MTQTAICQCDGSGWIQVYFLVTVTRGPGASWVNTDREPITGDVYRELEGKDLGADQKLTSGVKACSCRSAA